MTSTDGELGHALPVASSAEGDFPTYVWDPGSYLAAVRQDLASAFAISTNIPTLTDPGRNVPRPQEQLDE
jgi:hypothetical protein